MIQRITDKTSLIMKNIPKKIYLQIEGSDVTIDKSTTDWNDLFQSAITWSDHRINDNDIEFVLSDVSQQRELLNDLADRFNESTHTYVGQTMIEETLKAFNCG